jgi:hypothetical protein
MRLDSRVNRRKYDRELDRLVAQRALLEHRGIFLLSKCEFPRVHVLYTSRHAVQIAVARPPASGLVLPQGSVAMAVVEIPALTGAPFLAEFDLTDYDLRAPSVEFRHPATGELLKYATMFRAVEFERDRKEHLVLLDDHPTTHKPFLCLRGIREYHEHPQHSGDEWLAYRRDMSLFSAVMALWRVAVDLVHPVVVPAPGSLQVMWKAEERL